MSCEFPSQLSNKNFLYSNSFIFKIARFPKASYFCTRANIPGMESPALSQNNYLKRIPVPSDQIQFSPLVVEFKVDEDLVNYTILHNWMIGLGFPKTTEQFAEFTSVGNGDRRLDRNKEFSDASLTVLNSSNNPIVVVKFNGAHPISLSGIQFEADQSDAIPVTATVTFDYTLYELTDTNGEIL